MKEYSLEKISFGTYIKLMLMSSLGMGLIFGVFALILSIFNGDAVYITINGEVTTGIVAGLGGLVLYPLMLVIIFSIFGIFLYLGFKLIMKIKKSIRVKLQIKENL